MYYSIHKIYVWNKTVSKLMDIFAFMTTDILAAVMRLLHHLCGWKKAFNSPICDY